MIKEEDINQLPYQVRILIDSLLDKTEKVHIRGNYRMRLESIKRAAEKAIVDYDIEMGNVKPPRYGKGQR